MIRRYHHLYRPAPALLLALAGFLLSGSWLRAQTPPAAAQKGKEEAFFIHAFHATQLNLDCSTCHVPTKQGSVEFQRPGHDQCMPCHQAAYESDPTAKLCGQCHSEFPPTGAESLYPFPRYKGKRAILSDFSHARHVDPQNRVNAKTGFRADCTFCHTFDEKGVFAKFPGHVECAGCHSKAGMTPRLTAASETKDCRVCHTPEEIENPGSTKKRKMVAERVVSGVYANVKFSHIAHFREKEKYTLNCTTCHIDVSASTSLANLDLPKMVDCVGCHDTSKELPADLRMSNCHTCHIDDQGSKSVVPASHTRWVKPDFHTESFRVHHEERAEAPDAKCFVCHTNVSASRVATNQCLACHQVMRPVSHTARWRDDIHGKLAALDRTTCAMCHTADYCMRCHNETPRSHEPLALFKAGAHARPAMLDQRSCMTCHTFENTCAECHTRSLR